MRPTLDFDDWMPSLDIPSNPAVRVTILMYKTAKLTADVQDALNGKQDPIPQDKPSNWRIAEESMNSLINRLQLLDLEFESFAQQLPVTWVCEEMTPEEYSPMLPRWSHEFRQGKVLKTLNFATVVTWQLWRATRIKLLMAWLDVLALQDFLAMQSQPIELFDNPQLNTHATNDDAAISDKEEHIRTTICRLMDDICASVLPQLTVNVNGVSNPATMEDACGSRGYKLTWALRVVQDTCTALHLHDRLPWVENVLSKIENEFSCRKWS